MPLIVRNVAVGLDEPSEALSMRIAHALKIPTKAVLTYGVLRRALDARRNGDIRWVYHVAVRVDGDERKVLRRLDSSRAALIVPPSIETIEYGAEPLNDRPVVIGSGPAGLFAALFLAEHGYRPLLLERGQDAQLRHRARHLFYTTGQFDPENNLLFGIGGAGTYSDGKLYSRTHDARNVAVLEYFVRFGADPDILINAKPHIGSDRLPGICRKIVKRIVECGGEVRYGAKVVDIETASADPSTSSDRPAHAKQLTGVTLASGERIVAGACILAIGYSARDTYRMLADRGVILQAKPFQMGVRIEHPQEMVNQNQFGSASDHLPPADYHVIAKNAVPVELQMESAGPDLWSFCMCPGGIILPSNESAGEICTNGASNAKRNSPFANSGLVVTIPPSMFNDDPFAGIEYQRHWERLAYQLSGSYAVPAQRADDYLGGRKSDGELITSYPLGARSISLREMLPEIVRVALERGLPLLDRMIPGYVSAEGIITAPETRASSPVRILRGEPDRQSVSVAGIYPVGEGAGYSGGIVSSATDGLKSAEAVVARFAPLR